MARHIFTGTNIVKVSFAHAVISTSVFDIKNQWGLTTASPGVVRVNHQKSTPSFVNWTSFFVGNKFYLHKFYCLFRIWFIAQEEYLDKYMAIIKNLWHLSLFPLPSPILLFIINSAGVKFQCYLTVYLAHLVTENELLINSVDKAIILNVPMCHNGRHASGLIVHICHQIPVY